jgi:hypothetical protein
MTFTLTKTNEAGSKRATDGRLARWSAGAAFGLALLASSSPRAQTAPLADPEPAAPTTVIAPEGPEPQPPGPETPSAAAPDAPMPPPLAPVDASPEDASPVPSPPICVIARAPGAETHDQGYFHFELGPNSSVFRAAGVGKTTTVSGEGASLAVELGWIVAPNLAIYGKLMDAGASDPDISTSGQTTFIKGDSDIFGVGPGFTYYFPGNFFAGSTLMAARISVTDPNDHTLMSSNWGVAFDAVFGKEWWISDQWGIGVSGQWIVGEMPGNPTAAGGTPGWSARAWSLLFSATYN